MNARSRPGWYRYGLDIAEVVATRSEDPYVQVGAVVFRPDFSVAGVGYNGPPPGVDIDWTDRDSRRELMIHAEVNALRYASRAEVAGGCAAVSSTPCPQCLTVMAASGIAVVVYRDLLDNYPALVSHNVADRLGVHLVKVG